VVKAPRRRLSAAAKVTRIFNIGSAIDVVIEDLAIAGGRALDGANGAAEVTEPTVEPAEDGEPGGNGGAILSAADQLTLNEVVLEGNRAGDGGDGGSATGSGTPGQGGVGGGGGAIFVDSGELRVERSELLGNEAGDGGESGLGSLMLSPGGDGGNGGAIESEGFLVVTESTIAENAAGNGTAGKGNFLAGVVASRPGGNGGGIFAGEMEVRGSTFSSNRAGQGGAGFQVGVLSGTTLEPGGSGGSGGAIFNAGVENTIENSTFVGNRAGQGGPGAAAVGLGGTSGEGGSGGDGGAILAGPGAQTAAYAVTALENEAGAPGPPGFVFTIPPFSQTPGPPGPEGSGGAFAEDATGELVVHASIAADNKGLAANCGAGVEDGGENLAFPDAGGCTGFTVADPMLDPAGLEDNGGPTETIALEAGSAAIDAVPAEDCLTVSQAPLETDQRGEPRPGGPACDAGAFEGLKSEPDPQPEPKQSGTGSGDPSSAGQSAEPAPPVADTPETRWVKKPKARIATRKGRARVHVRFSSEPRGASFECRLGKKPYRPCKSPTAYWLKAGRHAIRVRAILNGVADPSPLVASFKVTKLKAPG
jgi:hypothetical protein